ncbi:MAG TPA: hypothetical protein VKC89_02365 [Patescibacteria group bacterium]|nr:hypothetical protein [Patescibacteria group bacterium]
MTHEAISQNDLKGVLRNLVEFFASKSNSGLLGEPITLLGPVTKFLDEHGMRAGTGEFLDPYGEKMNATAIYRSFDKSGEIMKAGSIMFKSDSAPDVTLVVTFQNDDFRYVVFIDGEITEDRELKPEELEGLTSQLTEIKRNQEN